MTLYDVPLSSWKRWKSADTSIISKRISNIRNYFNYHIFISNRGGSRGLRGGIEAEKELKHGAIKGGYYKVLLGRLDKDFTCNTDQISMEYTIKGSTSLYDHIVFKLGRTAR